MSNKMAVILFMIALLLVGLLGCGGDGTGSVPRVSPLGIVTGSTDSGDVTGGGGGGGGTGACVFGSGCSNNVPSASCSAAGGSPSSQTCQQLGYTCQIVSGYEVCM